MTWLRFLPHIIAGVAVVGAIWWVYDLRRDNAALTAENAALTRSVAALERQAEQARLAREVEAARATFERQRAEEMAARVREFLDNEGIADADLDPAIADFVNGLRAAD